jgi:hypothetical protein
MLMSIIKSCFVTRVTVAIFYVPILATSAKKAANNFGDLT